MTEQEFKKQMIRARKRVAKMDSVDGHKDRHQRTIYLALECGIKCPESGAQFDALVMLEDLRDILDSIEDDVAIRTARLLANQHKSEGSLS